MDKKVASKNKKAAVRNGATQQKKQKPAKPKKQNEKLSAQKAEKLQRKALREYRNRPIDFSHITILGPNKAKRRASVLWQCVFVLSSIAGIALTIIYRKSFWGQTLHIGKILIIIALLVFAASSTALFFENKRYFALLSQKDRWSLPELRDLTHKPNDHTKAIFTRVLNAGFDISPDSYKKTGKK